jgi:hypothetical protein
VVAIAWTALGVLAALAAGMFTAHFGIGGRIDGLGARIDAMGASLSGRIDAMGAGLNGRIDGLAIRLDSIEASLEEHKRHHLL